MREHIVKEIKKEQFYGNQKPLIRLLFTFMMSSLMIHLMTWCGLEQPTEIQKELLSTKATLRQFPVITNVFKVIQTIITLICI